MSITVEQIILDAQRIANRTKDLEALGNAVLVDAEGANRQIESMKQFQDDLDSLNKLSRDKSNSDMVNRINQQNPSIREIRQENRELKASLEDHQRALELIMHKYREHTQHKILNSQTNFNDLYNEKLSDVIKKQAEKINEMAAVMQKAALIDDEKMNKEIESISRLKIENQGLRELLQISQQFGSSVNQMETEKDVQNDINNHHDKTVDKNTIKLQKRKHCSNDNNNKIDNGNILDIDNKKHEQQEQNNMIMMNGEDNNNKQTNLVS